MTLPKRALACMFFALLSLPANAQVVTLVCTNTGNRRITETRIIDVDLTNSRYSQSGPGFAPFSGRATITDRHFLLDMPLHNVVHQIDRNTGFWYVCGDAGTCFRIGLFLDGVCNRQERKF